MLYCSGGASEKRGEEREEREERGEEREQRSERTAARGEEREERRREERRGGERRGGERRGGKQRSERRGYLGVRGEYALKRFGDVALVDVRPGRGVERARIVRVGCAREAAVLLHVPGVVQALVVHRPLGAAWVLVEARQLVASPAAALAHRVVGGAHLGGRVVAAEPAVDAARVLALALWYASLLQRLSLAQLLCAYHAGGHVAHCEVAAPGLHRKAFEGNLGAVRSEVAHAAERACDAEHQDGTRRCAGAKKGGGGGGGGVGFNSMIILVGGISGSGGGNVLLLTISSGGRRRFILLGHGQSAQRERAKRRLRPTRKVIRAIYSRACRVAS